MSRWMLTTVWAPGSATEAESFLWHRPDSRLQLGVALLWKQGAFRGLGNYLVIPEKDGKPNLRVGFGLQGIGTGNPGYFATSEKTWAGADGTWNGYLGIGYRTNEDHGHGLAGLKFTPAGSTWTLGGQHDGHNMHLFVNKSLQNGFAGGVYLIEMKSLGVMLSYQR